MLKLPAAVRLCCFAGNSKVRMARGCRAANGVSLRAGASFLRVKGKRIITRRSQGPKGASFYPAPYNPNLITLRTGLFLPPPAPGLGIRRGQHTPQILNVLQPFSRQRLSHLSPDTLGFQRCFQPDNHRIIRTR